MFNEYTVNNLSYLMSFKENLSFHSSNKVDNVCVALNFIDNKAYQTIDILDNIKIGDYVTDDLFIANIKVEEYEKGLNNLIIQLRSKSFKELINLNDDFNHHLCALVYNQDDKKVYIERSMDKLSKLKKAYPVLIPIGTDDEEQYLMHHNFFAGSLFVYKYNDSYVMELITPNTHPVISEMIQKRFDNFNLVKNTIEELLETFYMAFCGNEELNRIKNSTIINSIDENIKEYETFIKSYEDKIRLLKDKKSKILNGEN